MTNLISGPRRVVANAKLLTKVRTLVVEQLGIDIEDINVNSHFANDFGLDPLDILELVILIEEQFPNLVVIERRELSCFADLIEQIQFVDNQMTRPIWHGEHCELLA